jgi:hypothetical protein
MVHASMSTQAGEPRVTRFQRSLLAEPVQSGGVAWITKMLSANANQPLPNVFIVRA